MNKDRLIYIVATNLNHPGLKQKFAGQLAAFQQTYKATLCHYNYGPKDNKLQKVLRYLAFEWRSYWGMRRAKVIYMRYDPKALFSNWLACRFADRKPVVLEHNAIFDVTLKNLNRPWERRLHRYWMRKFAKAQVKHVGVSREITAHLIKDHGINADLTSSIHNGFSEPEADSNPADATCIAKAKALKAKLGSVGIFIGSGYPWHGIEQIIDLFTGRADCGLLVVGHFPGHEDQDNIKFLGSQLPATNVALFAYCDFGVSGFNNAYNQRTLVSHIKVTDYLGNGLPVLVNNDESASEEPELAPFIFNYHQDKGQFEAILSHKLKREHVAQVSREVLDWHKRLTPVRELIQHTPALRVLIPLFTGVGNAVLLLPFLTAIRDQLPHVSVTLFCDKQRHLAELFPADLAQTQTGQLQGDFDVLLHTIVAGHKKTLLKAKKQNPALSVLGQHYRQHRLSLYERVFGLLTGMAYVKIDAQAHESEQYLQFLPKLGGSIPKQLPSSPFPVAAVPDDFLVDTPYCVVQLGAAFGVPDTKLWPLSHWIQLLTDLCTQQRVVLVGSPNEKPLGDEVAEQVKHPNLENWIGKTDLKQVIAIIQSSNFVLGVDSSIGHISGAMNQNTLILWGPTHFEKSHQLGNNTHFINLNKPCAPCRGPERMGLYNGPDAIKHCQISQACMQEITPNMALQTLTQLKWL